MDTIIKALTDMYTQIVNFVPRFITGLIVLLIGYLVSRLFRWIITFVLRRIRFDTIMERTGITTALAGLGVRAPISAVIGGAIYFFLLLSFAITSTRIMGLDAIADILQRVLTYLPQAVGAAIVVIGGSLVARFLGTTTATVAAAAGIGYSSALGRLVQYLITIFTFILALGLLGVDTGILTTTLTVLIASAGLAIALAFGFGARETVHHIVSGHYVRQTFRIGQTVTVGDQAGTIRAIGTVKTTLDTPGGGQLTVPNALLIESIARIAAATPPPDAPLQP